MPDLTFSKGEKAAANGIGAHVAYNEGPASAAIGFQQEQDKWTPPPRRPWTPSPWALITISGLCASAARYARSSKANITSSGSQDVFTAGVRIPYGPGEIRASVRSIDETARKSATDASSDVRRRPHRPWLRLASGCHYRRALFPGARNTKAISTPMALRRATPPVKAQKSPCARRSQERAYFRLATVQLRRVEGPALWLGPLFLPALDGYRLPRHCEIGIAGSHTDRLQHLLVCGLVPRQQTS